MHVGRGKMWRWPNHGRMHSIAGIHRIAQTLIDKMRWLWQGWVTIEWLAHVRYKLENER